MTAELSADCARCAALCCLALALDEGEAFAIDKPAGLPCPKLAGHACSIHDRLEERGFPGCARYDCLGAGQTVTQDLFEGRSWREDPSLAAPMMQAFAVLREVQDLRAQLHAAAGLGLGPEQEEAAEALNDRLSPDWSPEAFADFDLIAARAEFAAFLDGLRASPPRRVRA